MFSMLGEIDCAPLTIQNVELGMCAGPLIDVTGPARFAGRSRMMSPAASTVRRLDPQGRVMSLSLNVTVIGDSKRRVGVPQSSCPERPGHLCIG